MITTEEMFNEALEGFKKWLKENNINKDMLRQIPRAEVLLKHMKLMLSHKRLGNYDDAMLILLKVKDRIDEIFQITYLDKHLRGILE